MTELPLLTRRRLLGLFGAAASLPVLSACGSSVGSGGGGGGGGGGGAVKVGLVIPQSGVYASLGTDMQRGWDLWMQQNGNRFGNFEVTTVAADEGETTQSGQAAVQRVLQAEQVDVVVGIVSSPVAAAAAQTATEAGKLLVVTNAGAAGVTSEENRSPTVWRTSFQNAQVAAAMGTYLAEQGVDGGVYVIAPDYAAGDEVIAGFTEAFEAGGGEIAGTAQPGFTTTTDYQPFLTPIEQSGAGATFCFFAGAEAVSFVTQYNQFGVKDTVPLYGSGFVTEGGVLNAQGEAALGVQTSLHYSDQLDNPANQAFVEAYQAAYDAPPTCYAVQTYDAAVVLAQALATVDAVDGETLAGALGGVGEIADSPRGPWSFDGQSPRQTMYLREVQQGGDRLVNAVTGDLGVVSQV